MPREDTDIVMTHTTNESGEVTYVARFSFYDHECGRLIGFINEARKQAEERGERFYGISADIDSDGFVFIYSAGMDPIKL